MLKGIAVRRFWLSLLENTRHSIKEPTMILREKSQKKAHTVFMFVLLITFCFLYQLIISPILYSVFQRWLKLKGPFMLWVWYHGNIITPTDLNLAGVSGAHWSTPFCEWSGPCYHGRRQNQFDPALSLVKFILAEPSLSRLDLLGVSLTFCFTKFPQGSWIKGGII